MNKQFAALLLILGVIVLTVFLIVNNQPSEPVKSLEPLTEMKAPKSAKNSSLKQYREPPAMQLDPNKSYSAIITTSLGKITVALDTKDTPLTSNNFVFLAREKFYNNTIFHRVIAGFMIQGGDPLGNGTGGPGYQFADEPITKEYTRGVIAMANAGPNTNGSQFFIMHQNTPLPKDYVIFGAVTEGLEVVDKIATTEVNGESPVKPVVIKTILIKEQ
jgi:cyclophilin family peptidyl-prolyl cis-trans isomerase